MGNLNRLIKKNFCVFPLEVRYEIDGLMKNERNETDGKTNQAHHQPLLPTVATTSWKSVSKYIRQKYASLRGGGKEATNEKTMAIDNKFSKDDYFLNFYLFQKKHEYCWYMMILSDQ